jgi:hypothetical protein
MKIFLTAVCLTVAGCASNSDEVMYEDLSGKAESVYEDIGAADNYGDADGTGYDGDGVLGGSTSRDALGAETDGRNNGGELNGGANSVYYNPLGIDLSVDMELNGIKIGISEVELLAIMDEEPFAITENENSDDFSEKIYEFSSGLTAVFEDWRFGTGYELVKLIAASDRYETPRGLKVSSTVEELIELYGEAYHVSENEWAYALPEGDYVYYIITVEDGIVAKITLRLPL